MTPLTRGRVAHGCAVTDVGGQSVVIVSGGQDAGQMLDIVEVLDYKFSLNMYFQYHFRHYHLALMMKNLDGSLFQNLYNQEPITL